MKILPSRCSLCLVWLLAVSFSGITMAQQSTEQDAQASTQQSEPAAENATIEVWPDGSPSDAKPLSEEQIEKAKAITTEE